MNRIIGHCVTVLLLVALDASAHGASPVERSPKLHAMLDPLTLDAPSGGGKLPFSFLCGDQRSDDLLAAWKRTATRRDVSAGELRVIVWSAPAAEGGLRVTWTVLFYRNHDAVEWSLAFENAGDRKTPPLHEVTVLRHDVQGLPRRLVHVKGGVSVAPIEGERASGDYETTCARIVPDCPRVTLSGQGGLSSNGDLPFWMTFKKDSGGFYYGLGWTGQWKARLEADDNGLAIDAGMEHLNLSLNPGERISQPTVLVGEFSGDRWAGHNSLRRILREHYTATVDGAELLPPVSWNSWFTLQNGISEENLLEFVNVTAPLGVEYFCVDAGWFNVDHPQCGDWRVNAKKFPHGLEPIAAAIRGRGMKTGLWFDPERVTQQAYEAFPRKELLKRGRQELLPGVAQIDAANAKVADFWLVDLSMPEAQDWMVDLIAGHAERLDLGWIRWDMNFPPLGMWLNDAAGQPDRLGWKEIKYVEGLYATMDRVRARCPNLVIEWCAGGGRRIDLESLRRTHTLWRSDITGDGEDTRAHLSGGSMWLPGNRLNSNLIKLGGPYDYYCQFGGPLGFGRQFSNRHPETLAAATRLIREFKDLRRFLLEDFYPLFPYSVLTTGWDGWQFHDPTSGNGFFLVLRLGDSPYREATIKLHGLDPARRYRLTSDVDVGRPTALTGAELMEGIAMRIEQPRSARVVRYAAAP